MAKFTIYPYENKIRNREEMYVDLTQMEAVDLAYKYSVAQADSEYNKPRSKKEIRNILKDLTEQSIILGRNEFTIKVIKNL